MWVNKSGDGASLAGRTTAVVRARASMESYAGLEFSWRIE